MNKKIYFFLLFLTACAGNPPTEQQQQQPAAKPSVNQTISSPNPTTGIKLPLTTNWQEWHCQDNYSFSVRFADSSQQVLELRNSSGVQRLNRENSAYPAIYESPNLAFFSNGKSAVLGTPKTDAIIASGCLPR